MIGGPAAGLETDFRPHFFAGVATVVAKLLLAGLPDRAYFGEKDFQQLLVVKQLVRDLNIPTEIVGCATIREPTASPSPHATSISPDERARAPRLNAVLRETAEETTGGGQRAKVLAEGGAALEAAGFVVDYLELRNAETLGRCGELATAAPPARRRPPRQKRLIDNIAGLIEQRRGNHR